MIGGSIPSGCAKIMVKKGVVKKKAPIIEECIFRRNHFSGHAPQHKSICASMSCDKEATNHIYTIGYCANMCNKCGERMLNKHPKMGMVDGVYINDL